MPRSRESVTERLAQSTLLTRWLPFVSIFIFMFGPHILELQLDLRTSENVGGLVAVLLSVLVVSIRPARSLNRVQLVCLPLTFIAAHIYFYDLQSLSLGAIIVLTLAALLLGLRFLPLEKTKIYWAAIWAGVLANIIFAWAYSDLLDWEYKAMVFSFASLTACFFLTAAAIRAGHCSRTWSQILRPMTASFTGTGPLPVEELNSIGRSPELIISGSLWIAGGGILHLGADLLPMVASGASVIGALLHWIHGISWLMANFARTCGFCRIMGMNVSFPVHSPWRALDFADYWKKANFARYRMFQSVFWNPLSDVRNPLTLALRICGVFMISAILNFQHSYHWTHFLRWGIEAILTFVSILVAQALGRRRINSYLKTGKRCTPSNSKWSMLVRVALCFFVILIHGYLYELDSR